MTREEEIETVTADTDSFASEGRDVREAAEEFDGRILDAIKEKTPVEIFELIHTHNPLLRWDLVKFVDTYRESGIYQEDRLKPVFYHLMDLKLMLYFVSEVDLGLSNAIYYLPLHQAGMQSPSPLLTLRKLSIDHSIIGKSRVAWERLMNAIYHLEFGRDLDRSTPKRKSKKSFFFDAIQEAPKWVWLEPYRKVVSDYDEKFRTSEFHKSSILRGEFLGTRKIDLNELLTLVNYLNNNIWDNLISIVAGDNAIRFTDLHMLPDGSGINSRYMPQ
ncbi:hypothetical protein ABT052_02605 [Streptomyces sp. NPDC002766]|uniref:hypothetical protein n=1 Tax=Streptomyces sp. NPDC002766 TaxID=3154429 RepID=UPI003330C4A7